MVDGVTSMCMHTFLICGLRGVEPTQGTNHVNLPLVFRSCCCTVRILQSCCHGDVGQSADVPEQPGSSVGNGEQTASAGKGSRLQQNIGQQDSPELRQLLTAKEQNQCAVWQIKLHLDFMVRMFKHNLKRLFAYVFVDSTGSFALVCPGWFCVIQVVLWGKYSLQFKNQFLNIFPRGWWIYMHFAVYRILLSRYRG